MVKYRKCKICGKKVEKDKDCLAVMPVDKKNKHRGWYHLSCHLEKYGSVFSPVTTTNGI